ncbi:MAG: carboxylating nicotinate-nucleotide diphosphorylase [Bdellovibrionota bacterium]
MLSPISLKLIQLAIKEDVGSGDITTLALIPPDQRATARIIAKEALTVCGNKVAETVFHQLDSEVDYRTVVEDGEIVAAGGTVAELSGSLATLLQGERTALNFMQRLSGVATLTAAVVAEVSHTKAQILDTRKTTPGWRELEKYAVRCGGGTNHRLGLFDQVLIKNNHLDATGADAGTAVKIAREKVRPGVSIEVEVRNIDELTQAAKARPDLILFDNMSPPQLVSALIVLRTLDPLNEIKTEASGGITLDNVRQYAETGVDSISLGLLTHSARAVDLSLRIQHEDR